MSRFFSRDSLFSAAIPCLTAALLLSPSLFANAQAPSAAPTNAAAQAADPTQAPAQLTMQSPAAPDAKAAKGSKSDGKLVPSKDTKRSQKKIKKTDPLAGVDSKLPDKQLYDKAMIALKKGKYDIARLDLQTLLNTYPDSQFQMRAKLAIGDSWYREGGTAALTQAEAEYKDFITFFPNAPEAAEAQMRVADIYYRQMDKPDRDYSKAQRAEDEYRAMIQQFPDSTLIPQAKQQLRQVQEVLATREAEVAAFYASHFNWAATIARYQSLVDAYPLYSHSDDALIGLGDAYGAEAKLVALTKLPEGPKAVLEKIYRDQAAAAYSRVITRYSAAPHVDDAKDRLAALGYPIPTPTAAQIATSEAEEQSRATVTLRDRALVMITRRPDSVSAARIGEPSLVDPKPVNAPDITKQSVAAYNAAMNPAPTTRGPGAATDASAAAGTSATPAAADSAAAAQAETPAAAPQLQDVPTASVVTGTGSVVSNVPTGDSGSANSAPAGNSNSVEIVSPSAAPATGASVPPITPQSVATPPPPVNNGLTAVGPKNTVLPPAEKPEVAPDAINDITSAPSQQAQAAPSDGKKTPKPGFDAKDESSSKHKKKKGLKKLNPF